jgi:TDG/mug DNA glycosylase family protein
MISGFSPISFPDARVLILGSFPSQRSLEAGQYYAHPQNAFWFIIERLFARETGLDYTARTTLLMDVKVALWDVLRTADRPGSLDSAIVAGSEVPNDFVEFFARHPAIRTVFFNGTKAQSLFERHVMGDLETDFTLRLVRLPSTSPANAGLTRERKLELWRAGLKRNNPNP